MIPSSIMEWSPSPLIIGNPSITIVGHHPITISGIRLEAWLYIWNPDVTVVRIIYPLTIWRQFIIELLKRYTDAGLGI